MGWWWAHRIAMKDFFSRHIDIHELLGGLSPAIFINPKPQHPAYADQSEGPAEVFALWEGDNCTKFPEMCMDLVYVTVIFIHAAKRQEAQRRRNIPTIIK